MWTRHSIALACWLLTGAGAFAQASLTPNPTPRLPPQEGQGLAAGDEAFIRHAVNFSQAEVEAARLASERASDPAVKALSAEILAKHEELGQRLQQEAARFKAPEAAAGAAHAWDDDITRLKGLQGEAFDKDYLGWQLRAHLGLVNLYQTQASHTPESDLAKFSITTLAAIQQQFGALREIGAKYDLKVETVGQPPQY
ncbi:DUF4142 domain-containing protein [Terrihabitans sp. B22-R8]|uniref:DUF4142 domain-containing protein n=1 Tax=Terrihabitans sp. B22-R8 TaxID=3425128 RepID=UPI00403C4AE7